MKLFVLRHGDICKAINAIINDIDSSKEIVKFDQKNAEVVEYKVENTFRK